MANSVAYVWIDSNGYLYSTIDSEGDFCLSVEDLQQLKTQGQIDNKKIIFAWRDWTGTFVDSIPSDAVYLTSDSEAWAQIQAGTFVYPPVIPDNTVHLKTGTFAEYTSADKDSNSLYFIADKGIYKGDQQLVSVNADLTVDNTNKNVVLTLNGQQLSANVAQSVLDQIADSGIDIGEIPEYIPSVTVRQVLWNDIDQEDQDILYAVFEIIGNSDSLQDGIETCFGYDARKVIENNDTWISSFQDAGLYIIEGNFNTETIINFSFEPNDSFEDGRQFIVLISSYNTDESSFGPSIIFNATTYDYILHADEEITLSPEDIYNNRFYCFIFE